MTLHADNQKTHSPAAAFPCRFFLPQAMTAVEELESRRANRALDTDDSNYGLPTYVLRPSARHAHAAAYIAQTGRSVGLELVAHRVAESAQCYHR